MYACMYVCMSGWIFQKVLAEIVQKGLILSQKDLISNRRNSKIDALSFKRQQIERSLFLIAELFYQRFFPSRKTPSKVCTVAWFWQPASGQFLSRS